MPKAKAGIYFEEGKGGALDAYLELSEARRLRLKAFLNRLLESLQPPPKSKGTPLHGVVQRGEYEWEPDCLVVWRVALKPAESVPSMTRIDAYRIEVLLIRTGL